MASADEYVMRFDVRRSDWLKAEWPLATGWVGTALLFLAGIAWATRFSKLSLGMLIPWFFFFGIKVVRVVAIVIQGNRKTEVKVTSDGIILVSVNGRAPQYAYWQGFVNLGSAFLLWGADGQYRLIIPRKAVSPVDNDVIRERTGVDLFQLAANEERSLRPRPGPGAKSAS